MTSLKNNTSPGPKYNLISAWLSKDKSKKNLLQSTSNLRQPGIYN